MVAGEAPKASKKLSKKPIGQTAIVPAKRMRGVNGDSNPYRLKKKQQDPKFKQRVEKNTVHDPNALKSVLRRLKASQGGKKRYRRGKYDWPAIREYFITSPENEISLLEVARTHGVPEASVYKRSKEENWKWLRMQYWTQILRERRHRRQITNAEESEKFDDMSLQVARTGMQMVQLRMGQMAMYFHAKQTDFNYAIEKLRGGIPVTREDFYSAINYKELRDLGQAALMFQELGRKALGADMAPIDIGDLPPEEILGGNPDEAMVSIGDELTRHDPDRIAAMLEGLADAGMLKYQVDQDGNIVQFDIDGEWLDAEDPHKEVLEIEAAPESTTTAPEANNGK